PVLDYIVVNRERVEEYRSQLPGLHLHLVTLAPGVETALTRDLARPEKTVGPVWTFLDEMLRRELHGVGLWLDNSVLAVEETVDAILQRQAEARLVIGE